MLFYSYNFFHILSIFTKFNYTSSSNSGAHVGEPRYKAYIENHDLNTLIWVSSPDANETAKMASTLKFK